MKITIWHNAKAHYNAKAFNSKAADLRSFLNKARKKTVNTSYQLLEAYAANKLYDKCTHLLYAKYHT